MQETEWERTKNKNVSRKGGARQARKPARVKFQKDRKPAPKNMILSFFRVLSCFSWFIFF